MNRHPISSRLSWQPKIFRLAPRHTSLPRVPSSYELLVRRRRLILESNHLSLIQHGWYRRRSDSGIIYRVFLQRLAASARTKWIPRERKRCRLAAFDGILSIPNSPLRVPSEFPSLPPPLKSLLHDGDATETEVFAFLATRKFEALFRYIFDLSAIEKTRDWATPSLSRVFAISKLATRKTPGFVCSVFMPVSIRG